MNKDLKRKKFYKELNHFLVLLNEDYLENYGIRYEWNTTNDEIYAEIITKIKFIVDDSFEDDKGDIYEMSFIYTYEEQLCYINNGSTSVPIDINEEKEITNFFIEMFLFNKIELEGENK
jgi:hypothetical protein